MVFIAIPDLLAAALVALLLLAAGVMALVASHIIPNVPIIGGAIRGAVVGAIKAAAGALTDALDYLVAPLAFMVMALYNILAFSLYFTVALGERGITDARGALAWAEAGVARAEADAAGLFRAAEALARHLYGQALGYADRLYHDGLGYTNRVAHDTAVAAHHELGVAVGEVAGWVHTAETEAAAGIHDTAVLANHLAGVAIGDARGLFATAEADLARAVGGLEARIADTATGLAATAAAAAATAAAGAIAGLDQAAHDAVIGPWDALLDDAATVADAVGAELAQALGLPATLPHTLPLDVAGILALVVPVVGAVTAETARCTVPMCRNLGGLSALFGDLTDAGLYGLLVAFLAEAVTDPAAVVDEVDTVAGPAVAAVADAFRAVVGV